eukprot:252983_1
MEYRQVTEWIRIVVDEELISFKTQLADQSLTKTMQRKAVKYFAGALREKLDQFCAKEFDRRLSEHCALRSLENEISSLRRIERTVTALEQQKAESDRIKAMSNSLLVRKMQSILFKKTRSRFRSAWTRRFFVLSAARIFYFKSNAQG